MSEEDLIAADTTDTGAASTADEGDKPASQSAEQLLYGNNESGETADEQEQGQEQAEPGEAVVGAPEKYEIKFAETIATDPEVLQEFESVAREYNLTNEQAQKLADVGSKLSEKMAEKQAEVHAKQVEEWRSLSMSDKEFGGEKLNENIAVAKTAMTKFATPELVDLLNASGLGNHPEVIRAFYKVGKAISSDDKVVTGKPPVPPKSRAETLYGSSRT